MSGRRWMVVASVLAALLVTSADASAQSLFRRAPSTETSSVHGIERMSLYYVAPPEPRSFLVHDLVTIIIDETSRSQSDQSLETNKSYTLDGALVAFPDLKRLLDLQFRAGANENLANVNARFRNDFQGEGEYRRNDRMIARVTGRIIDVKPNGTLVIEARRTIANDEERKTIILSGVCRTEDITAENTVLSAQVADLRIEMIHEGEVRKAGRKGLIPRVLEAVFAF